MNEAQLAELERFKQLVGDKKFDEMIDIWLGSLRHVANSTSMVLTVAAARLQNTLAEKA